MSRSHVRQTAASRRQTAARRQGSRSRGKRAAPLLGEGHEEEFEDDRRWMSKDSQSSRAQISRGCCCRELPRERFSSLGRTCGLRCFVPRTLFEDELTHSKQGWTGEFDPFRNFLRRRIRRSS